MFEQKSSYSSRARHTKLIMPTLVQVNLKQGVIRFIKMDKYNLLENYEIYLVWNALSKSTTTVIKPVKIEGSKVTKFI